MSIEVADPLRAERHGRRLRGPRGANPSAVKERRARRRGLRPFQGPRRPAPRPARPRRRLHGVALLRRTSSGRSSTARRRRYCGLLGASGSVSRRLRRRRMHWRPRSGQRRGATVSEYHFYERAFPIADRAAATARRSEETNPGGARGAGRVARASSCDKTCQGKFGTAWCATKRRADATHRSRRINNSAAAALDSSVLRKSAQQKRAQAHHLILLQEHKRTTNV